MVLEMLAGGGLVVAGMLLDRLLPARRKGPKPPKPVRPICGCDHELAYHDPATGECHDTEEEPSRYNSYGSVTAYKSVQCTCRQYVGPQPLPEFYAPEVTG